MGAYATFELINAMRGIDGREATVYLALSVIWPAPLFGGR